MRQITQQASLAFAEGRNFKSWNTQVSIWIGEKWKIHSTKERLNWILDAFNLWKIFQKKGVWFYEVNEIATLFKDWMTLKIKS